MITINETINFIGNYSPLALIFLSIYLLYTSNSKTYLAYFILGIVFNTIINILLKGFFQQPRPSDMKHSYGAFQKRIQNILQTKHGLPFHLFGMPSGHAQATFFILTFMYLVFYSQNDEMGLKKYRPNWIILWIFILFGGIVLYQRVEYGYHTWFQVAVGILCGMIIGYGMYNIAKQKIKGVMHQRKDDYAFWTKQMAVGFL